MMCNFKEDKPRYRPPDIMKPITSLPYEYISTPSPEKCATSNRSPLPKVAAYKQSEVTIEVKNMKTEKTNGNAGHFSTRLTNRETTAVNATKREQALLQRLDDLQQELFLALAASEDIAALKVKVTDLCEKMQKEKLWRADVVAEKNQIVDKQDMLIDHIEKLMFQLKHVHEGRMKEKEEAWKALEMNKLLQKKINKQKRWAMSAKKCIKELQAAQKLLNGQVGDT